MNTAPIAAAYFWSKVHIGGSAMCWIWKGNMANGYGRFRGKRAHRFAYEMQKGEIPEGLMVRHLCGNKRCVNPAHLEPGTMADNSQDGIRLGEILRGARNGRSKLTEDDARYIIDNPDDLRGVDLARMFGVSRATVSLIKSGRRWAHHREAA